MNFMRIVAMALESQYDKQLLSYEQKQQGQWAQDRLQHNTWESLTASELVNRVSLHSTAAWREEEDVTDVLTKGTLFLFKACCPNHATRDGC